ncbi:MAG: site-2 protease family protein [Gemmatimonadetes bacterium]|nr:site-2 protease family protein [Gemmatimonadota bacterium]MCB9517848.1 site-2 protease family protein [Gemmatimonadales bacterium]
MGWSLTLGRVRGTVIRVHVTLLVFLAWYAWRGWQVAGPRGAVDQFAFLALLFLSVLLHEFGHIGAARHYGIPTPDVLLTPIGGLARIARMPERPREELVIALAGPLVTLVIALVLGAGIALGIGGGTFLPVSFDDVSLWTALAWTNVVLLVFNLIPAFPMDGGRVLRALLAGRLGMVRGTRIAVRVGQALAVGLAIVGLQGNVMLVLIAAFVFLGAEAEYAAVRTGRIGAPARLTDTDVRVIPLEATVREALALHDREPRRTHAVVDGEGRFHGLLTEGDLLRALAAGRADSGVVQWLAPPARTGVIVAGTDPDDAVRSLFASGRDALAVVDGQGRFLGLLTRDRVTDVLMAASLRPADPHE